MAFHRYEQITIVEFEPNSELQTNGKDEFKICDTDGTILIYYNSISNDSLIHLVLQLRGDKPVIYLYPEKDNFGVIVNVRIEKEDGEIASRYPAIRNNENNIGELHIFQADIQIDDF